MPAEPAQTTRKLRLLGLHGVGGNGAVFQAQVQLRTACCALWTGTTEVAWYLQLQRARLYQDLGDLIEPVVRNCRGTSAPATALLE